MKTLLLILALLVPSVAHGQILPFVEGFFVNNSGALLAGGKICTTITGTSTNLATYPTAADAVAATNPNANPVTLDAYGRASIFGNGTYRIIIYNSGTGNTCNGSAVGSAIKTIDGVVMSTVTTVSGTSNRIAKYTSASALGNSSIYDGYSGESIRIQADGTLSIGTTTDIAAGLYLYSAQAELIRAQTTQATGSIGIYGASGVMGTVSASVADGLFLGTSTTRLALNTAGTTFAPVTTDVMALGTSANRYSAANIMAMTGNTIALSGTTTANLTFSGATPTISSAFGTSPSVTGTAAAMRINVGTGGSASAGVIALPTAATGWNCDVENLTAATANVANARTMQLSSTTTTATFENQTISTGAALVWTASDILAASCTAY